MDKAAIGDTQSIQVTTTFNPNGGVYKYTVKSDKNSSDSFAVIDFETPVITGVSNSGSDNYTFDFTISSNLTKTIKEQFKPYYYSVKWLDRSQSPTVVRTVSSLDGRIIYVKSAAINS